MEDRQHTIVSMRLEDAESVGHVLADAFQGEPNFTYMLSDDEKRRNVLPWFLTVAVKAGHIYGEVYTTPDLQGAAGWLSPGKELGLTEMLRTGLIKMPFMFGWSAFMRSMRLNSQLEKIQQNMVGDRRWYLMVLGVAPSAQGKGLGGALMQPVLERADAAGIPCYLETFSERNVSFYQKHGFTVRASGTIAGDGPPYWIMMR
ncbi:MAG: GNAT family N-acetyltransferase [Chloroflexi bacterium]|nr:GNAT family N-acetyltransferase [Chloroflexota bacterium]